VFESSRAIAVAATLAAPAFAQQPTAMNASMQKLETGLVANTEKASARDCSAG
jgi:hypothetical protein